MTVERDQSVVILVLPLRAKLDDFLFKRFCDVAHV